MVFLEVLGKSNPASVHTIGLNYFFTCHGKQTNGKENKYDIGTAWTVWCVVVWRGSSLGCGGWGPGYKLALASVVWDWS